MKSALLMLAMMIVVSVGTFLFLVYHHPPDTIGQALLHLYYKSPTLALLRLPNDWRARYGIDRHEQCAILMDAALVSRLEACTFGYGPGNPEYRGEPVSAAARANRAAAPRNSGETVSSDIRETPLGPIHHVVRRYATSVPYYNVVTTGQMVEHEFFRIIGNNLVHLRTYEDAAQQSNLDPIAWELAQSAILVPEP